MHQVLDRWGQVSPRQEPDDGDRDVVDDQPDDDVRPEYPQTILVGTMD